MNCKHFARHIASGVEPLRGGLYGHFNFWLHWIICPFCRRYREEIKALGQIQRADIALRNHPAVKISEIKQRLKTKLMRMAS